MQEAGGRRIKRSLNIDLATIRFLSDEELEHFGKFALLKDYIAGKSDELEKWNEEFNAEGMVPSNARRLNQYRNIARVYR